MILQQQWTFPEIDRTAWGPGPWDGEPDKVQWKDWATGLPCLAVRQERAGHWCGYVGVPPGHPLHGLAYNAESAALAEALERRKQRPLGEEPGFPVMVACLLGADLKTTPDMALEVHGGLTFSDGCSHREGNRGICHVPDPGEPDDVWWFGFDFSHCRDVRPGDDARYGATTGSTYKTIDYVQAECVRLAAQLQEVACPSK